jgi:hypothetical protein
METGILINFLQSLSEMGAAMKNVMSKAMIDREIYERLVHGMFSTLIKAF